MDDLRGVFRLRVLPVLGLALMAMPALGNHGPGTSGGGSATISGETLKRNQFELDFRFDYTEFEHVDESEAIASMVLAGGHFDALERSYLTTATLSYGITDDFQISGSLGYYYGQDFLDVHSHGGPPNVGRADPQGITDLWLNVKYRVMKGAPGNLSLIGGIKLPTGKDDVMLDNAHALDPSSQPGSGSVDFQFGAAYSRFLTERITLDASGLYTLRTEHDDFKVGDRVDIGVATAYRITDDIQKFPNLSVFGELLGVWLAEDEDGGATNPNSGGWTMYLSPGARVRFSPNVALTVAPAFPVWQDVNGEQIETRFKLGISLTLVF